MQHPFVRILAGIPEFVGKTGVIIDKEGKQYRVQLDQPVAVPNVGRVTDDLWMPADLKVIRPVIVKPANKVPEAPEAAAAVEPGPAAAAEPQPALAGTLAALTGLVEAVNDLSNDPTTSAAERKGKKAKKVKQPKALTAKQEAQKRAGVKVPKYSKPTAARSARSPNDANRQ